MTKDSDFFAINASIDLLPTLSLDKSKLFLVELMTFMPSLDVYNGEKSWLFFIKLHAPDNWVSPEVDSWCNNNKYIGKWRNSWKIWK